MSEPMKVQVTGEYVDISVRIHAVYADRVKGALENILALINDEGPPTGDGPAEITYSLEEVFPEGITPGDVLRGLRYREGLTQAILAERIGVKPSHISDMENGKRPIGKEMAKRLGKALNAGYKIFL